VRFTVLGAHGFIGRHAVHYLRAQGHSVEAVARDMASLHGRDLGHVICAVGLTGNFRQKPADTIEAHASLPARLLAHLSFDSFLYMSSTRVYGGLPMSAVASEGTALSVTPSADSLYDLSKLTGEALCIAHSNPAVRVVRLSNVVGPGIGENTFLGSVLDEARRTGGVTIHEHPQSAKDYVMVDDVLGVMECIAVRGQQRVYNIAAGTNTSAAEVAAVLAAHHYTVDFSGRTQSPRVFPSIDTSRIRGEFDFSPSDFKSGFASLISSREENVPFKA
jgi:nucleoside-diphosphate-sugar epimerase